MSTVVILAVIASTSAGTVGAECRASLERDAFNVTLPVYDEIEYRSRLADHVCTAVYTQLDASIVQLLSDSWYYETPVAGHWNHAATDEIAEERCRLGIANVGIEVVDAAVEMVAHGDGQRGAFESCLAAASSGLLFSLAANAGGAVEARSEFKVGITWTPSDPTQTLRLIRIDTEHARCRKLGKHVVVSAGNTVQVLCRRDGRAAAHLSLVTGDPGLNPQLYLVAIPKKSDLGCRGLVCDSLDVSLGSAAEDISGADVTLRLYSSAKHGKRLRVGSYNMVAQLSIVIRAGNTGWENSSYEYRMAVEVDGVEVGNPTACAQRIGRSRSSEVECAIDTGKVKFDTTTGFIGVAIRVTPVEPWTFRPEFDNNADLAVVGSGTLKVSAVDK